MSYAVLIIEDEETLARNILRYLERAGYEARVANGSSRGTAGGERSRRGASA